MASAECVDIKNIDQSLYLSSIKAQELTYGTSTQYSCFEHEIDTLDELCDTSQVDLLLLL